MPVRRPLALGPAAALVAVLFASRASAQQAGDGGIADASPAPVAEAGAAATPAPPPSASGGAAPAPAAAPAAPAPPPPPPRTRSKPLRTSVGLSPTAADLGSEADIVSSADYGGTGTSLVAAQGQKFAFSMKGYLRAPMRISVGPSVNHRPGQTINELHSPPRMVGFGSGDWNYIALAPNTTGSLYLTAGIPNVTANVILATGTFYETGYKDLDQLGGIGQAYVTLKFPDLFGDRGGLAWTIGSFSNRYGNAGPNQTSSGYYGTYLFGRTHVAGTDVTADIDLTDHLELTVEAGGGAKV